MKKILVLLFTCMLTGLSAQKQYSCYHLQEFQFNSKTNAYDTPVERSDLSRFMIDDQKKMLIQSFEDGTSSTMTIASSNINPEKHTISYHTISPANGYTYIYRLSPEHSVIEVLLVRGDTEMLLKRYLYK